MGGIVEQYRTRLVQSLSAALDRAVDAGSLPAIEPPRFLVEVPREADHGDFATNLAMLLAKPAKMAPRKIAEAILHNLDLKGTRVERVEIAGPGFINFYLEPAWVLDALSQIDVQNENYGRINLGQGKKVQVEFVSANPTGLLHMGNARGAALGDTLASVLDFAGYDVEREFYINDAGNQIVNFGRSLEARYLQLLGCQVPFPEEGYHGEDVVETMRRLVAEAGDAYAAMDPAARQEALIKYALREKMSAIRETLNRFGVRYDVWFSEQELHEVGAVNEVIAKLRGQEYVYEQDGALWFKATAFGDEKDEVVVRTNGVPTYFAADIAYHRNKFQRGFQWIIDIWGADHHGHVSRMKGAMAALGYNPDQLDVVLMQLVRLVQGGEVLRMSKRTGQYITLQELIDEVGVDAARYFFVMRSPDSHLEFDLDLAKSQTAENPVYYVQYAHARISSILRQAGEQGYTMPKAGLVEMNVLTHPSELELIRKIADYPDVVAGAAQNLEPHRLTKYAQDLAALFHVFYTNCRVLVDEEPLRQARLVLIEATRITLRNLLGLIGVSAPERM
jgi:arginyl-tRNA synthetase